MLWQCCLGIRKSIWPVKNWVMGCLCGCLSGARCRLFAYGPADATASQNPIISCLVWIQTGFTLLAPAYSGCPGKEAVKRVRWCYGYVTWQRSISVVVRLLNVCAHVIDEATPGPPPTKPTLPSLPNPPSLSPIRRRGKASITGKEDTSTVQGSTAKEKGSARTPSKGLCCDGWLCRCSQSFH